MPSKKIEITGNNLHIRDIVQLVSDEAVFVAVSPAALANVKKSYEFLREEIDKKILYGVNTGFGPMATHILASGQLTELQYNLIRSHAVGMGKPINQEYILSAMVVRLNTLTKGYSGVSPELIKLLETFINTRIVPLVPEHGAVGTSGDLVQLAHIALALIGEGQVSFSGSVAPAAEVLKKLKLKPHQLQPKEGLALINGTSLMTGVGTILSDHTWRLLSIAVRTGALSLELVKAFNDGTSETLHSLRPHRGQQTIAKTLRTILESSHVLRKRSILKDLLNSTNDVSEIPQAVQEIYSLRCIPQILGPVFDTLTKTATDIEVEINSVTDNPIIDAERAQFLHGGNFHGDQIASALDFLKIATVKLTMLSERRINFFLNRNINKHFPQFLNLKKPGLTLGLQGLQFVATSTTAHSQSLAYPHHIHSISTNGDNQDVVSMGTDAALLAAIVVENAYIVLAIEVLTLAQAVDFLGNRNQLSESSRNLYDLVRKNFPVIIEDRYVADDLKTLVETLKSIKSELSLQWS